MNRALERLLARLETSKTKRPVSGGTVRLLRALERRAFSDAPGLIRFHEAVLFLRAYPPDRGTMHAAERILSRFGDRVGARTRSGGDLGPFDRPEVSGIAGTEISTDYSFDVVRWLASRFRRRVRLDWESDGREDRLRALLPRFLPLLEEEALEDANVPYLDWLRAAQPNPRRDLEWLVERIEELPLSDQERAERYEALKLRIVWRLGNGPVTRTRMRRRAPEIFLHSGPLIARRDVSLAEALASPPLPIRRLSRREGEEVVDLTRGATALRYREYYGFTYADPASVRAARAGRGVEIFFMGLERGRRLPLRAGFAAIVVKNGVPVGYVEGLALFERIEIGFNIYYTFREGESAWIFGRVLRLLNQILGVTSFSIDPYQLGHENPEAIDSGAFWFYRKLGFRPTSAAIARLVESEERKLASDVSYRSPRRVLRRLVTHNLLYEADPARSGGWDRFHVRNVGLAVQTRMRVRYGGDPDEARRRASSHTARLLGAPASRGEAFPDLALVLDVLPDVAGWTRDERKAVVAIVRAKAGHEEIRYLRLLQGHARLRRALIRLGSAGSRPRELR
ncbi:MAG TPA: hypothetical protein VF999_03245 [Thermoanaerobaculia bacterium]